MNPKIFFAVTVLVIVAGLVVVDRRDAQAGEMATPGTRCWSRSGTAI